MTDRELMQQALDALEVSTDWDMNATGKQAQSIQVINALRARLAQPDATINGMPAYEGPLSKSKRLAQPEPEPVAWYLPSDEGYDSMFRDHRTIVKCTGNPWTDWQPLYTAPPQREWVGLTDEEIRESLRWSYGNFARAIEAKLKEKNI